MAAVPVNVNVLSASVPSTPIAGATVSLLLPGSFIIAALAESDSAGVASFLVPGGTYELRVYRQGVAFSNPWRVDVLEDGTDNVFEITGTRIGQFGLPSDPRLCRCIGRFVGHQNEPVPDAVVRVVAEMDLLKKTPKVVDGNMVMPAELELRTDHNGYIVADLLRGGQYWFMFAGEEDQLWNFQVPDSPTTNLVDLIHPAPLSLTWDPPGPLNLKVGDAVLVAPGVLYTDGQDHMDKFMDVFELTNSDSLIATVAYQSETRKIGVTAVAPGTAQVTVAIRPDLYPSRIPNYSLAFDPLVINVTA